MRHDPEHHVGLSSVRHRVVVRPERFDVLLADIDVAVRWSSDASTVVDRSVRTAMNNTWIFVDTARKRREDANPLVPAPTPDNTRQFNGLIEVVEPIDSTRSLPGRLFRQRSTLARPQ